MYSFLLNKKISRDSVLPCYFFYGEELYIAFQFANELKEALKDQENQDIYVERYNIDEFSWMEVIDSARTIPFFFSPWRIIEVKILDNKRAHLTSSEQKLLEDFFCSPQSKTVLIIIFTGKLRRNSPLIKFFSSFKSSVVCVKEIKSLKGNRIFSWIEKKIQANKKEATFEAVKRLNELAGNDLGKLSNEVEKLVTFVGDKELIETDDVNQITGWIKSSLEWEVAESLEKGSVKHGLQVIDNLLNKEGVHPVFVLGLLSRFFRDLFLAKMWLKEKEKDRKIIFKKLRPHILEKFGSLYSRKFKAFYNLVDSMTLSDLSYILEELRTIDLKIKTSDVSPQILLERFLINYYKKETLFRNSAVY